MNKEIFRQMEREYNAWLQRHPKGDHNYKSFTHMRRSLEFAEYWHKKQVNDAKSKNGQALHKHIVSGCSLDLDRTRDYLTGKITADSNNRTPDGIAKTANDICETIKSGYLNNR